MKLFIIFITINLLSLPLLALEGTVIVLEAPLFSKPNTKTRIVQYLRKNDVINIHNQHAPPLLYQIYDEPILKGMSHSSSKFFTTLDRTGKTAYVLKDHVKLIYKDIREFYDRSKLKHDPTDYRLAEPLPENFPLQNTEKYIATVNLGLGSSDKISYPYPTSIDEEDYTSRKLVSLSYSKRIAFDFTNRLYFGVLTYYQQGSSKFTLNNYTTSRESSWQLGIGPYLSYLAYRNPRFHLSFYGGITYAYAKSAVKIRRASIDTTFERSFSGNVFKGRLGLQLAHTFLPGVDLTLSTQLEATLPHSLKSGDRQKATQLWNNGDDSISYSGVFSMSMLAGIVAYY